MRHFTDLFPALGHSTFRWFITSQLCSLLGYWMKRLAVSWLVYRLTGSAFLLGVVEFLALTPILFLGLFAGTWLEHHDLRKTLAVTQLLFMVEAALLTLLTFTGLINFPLLAGLSLFLGIVTAFEMIARQTSISLMLDEPSAVKSAVALNSMAFNISKLVGPSIAGVIVYLWGEKICFLIAALSYIPIVYVLFFRLRLRERVSIPATGSMIEEVKDGLVYVRDTFFMRRIFQILAMFCLMSLCYSVLFPMFSTQVLEGGSQTLGWLFAAVGAGAFTGGIVVSAFLSIRFVPILVSVTCLISSMAMLTFSLSQLLYVSLGAAYLLGLNINVTNISINTLLQTVAPEERRGRIMGLFLMCNTGLSPLGGLAFGALGDWLGAPVTMGTAAVILGISMLLYTRDLPLIRKSLDNVILP